MLIRLRALHGTFVCIGTAFAALVFASLHTPASAQWRASAPSDAHARFEAWRAANPDVEERVRRIVAATRTLAARGAHEEAPAIFRVDGVGMTIWDCALCPQLVVAPAGRYTIGSPENEPERGADEGPQRVVTIPYALAVGRYEVTRGQYEAFVRATGRAVGANCVTDRAEHGRWAPDPAATFRDPAFPQGDDHPVVCVSWEDAQAYVAWLNAQTRGGYRLLSEAEWEYLARAGTWDAYPWGASPDRGCADANGADATLLAHYPEVASPAWLAQYPYWATAKCSDGALNTAPVGSYRPNAFGLYDMIGNVGEWVADCYENSYANLPPSGAPNETNCAQRVVRGGAWGSIPRWHRSADRLRYEPTLRDDSVGIRVARAL
jgi:formylglycine-generating enzyme required for sulfatase activity